MDNNKEKLCAKVLLISLGILIIESIIILLLHKSFLLSFDKKMTEREERIISVIVDTLESKVNQAEYAK